MKNGFVTDTSYANIVFWDGGKWITPTSPLLHGTARDRLLDSNQITEAEIAIDDLKNYSKAKIINAMIDMDEGYDINQIVL